MNKEYYFTINEISQGQRIDSFLEKKLKDKNIKNITRSKVHKNICNIKVNNKNIKKNYILKTNDKIIYMHQKEIQTNKIIKENLPLEIIYEDNDIMLINKHIGIVVHPANGNIKGTILNAIIDKLEPKLSDNILNNNDNNLRPGIVHRLDKDCSGILIIAKKVIVQNRLINSFKNREINKEYYTIVKGYVEKEGKWDSFIGRDPVNRKRYTAKNNAIKPKSAITLFTPIKTYKIKNRFYTMLKIKLITGRTHQIRVHCKQNNRPILGDIIYSKQKHKIEKMGLALCAKKLEFKHPVNLKTMKFEVELPKHFKDIIYILENNNEYI